MAELRQEKRPLVAPQLWALVLAQLALSASCATTATGRKQLTFLPEDELRRMGEQAFQQMKSEQPVETDRETSEYVRCVAGAVVNRVEAGPGDWEVVVFRDESANAFALPGGKIGVHTGLLELARTQDQLAAVIGHEIAHVTQEHGNERLSQAFVAEGGLAAASVALRGDGASRDLALAAFGLGAQFGVLMPFGRAQESEADIVGLEYMARAGFDPRAAIELWQNMEAAGGAAPPSSCRHIQPMKRGSRTYEKTWTLR
jgi:predicted Zn-dependent protease